MESASERERMVGMDPALYKAATQGKVSLLRQLVKERPEILNSKTPQGNTALHLAAQHGNASFAREVVALSKELLVATNQDGDTPLHLAAKAGRLKVADLLVQEARSDEGKEAAAAAAAEGKEAAAAEEEGKEEAAAAEAAAEGKEAAAATEAEGKEAAAAEAEGKEAAAAAAAEAAAAVKAPLKNPLIITNNAGNTPLHEAVQHQENAVALMLLGADPSGGHDLNHRNESPLHMAAREGLFQVVRRIVEQSWVQPRYVPAVSVSGTALHQAVLGGYTKIVEILIERYPELLELTDSNGNNALHYAAQKNHRRTVDLLLNKRTALAYKPNRERQSPLHVAAHYGSTEAIAALLRHCPDVAEMVDSDGRNAFHVAVASGKTNALRCLLRHVRPPELLNRVDGSGNTPLHLAAELSHVQSALLLLKDSRVDPCVRNHDGETARSLLEARRAHDHTASGSGGHGDRSPDRDHDGHAPPHHLVDIRSGAGEMDAHEMYLWKQLKHTESRRCRKQQLPPVTVARDRRSTSQKYFERTVETYILVATLIATVTFAATFTMPGGYKQDSGIAIHGRNTAFKIFVISNTVAMCSSIVVVFCFIWAWQDPVRFKVEQLLWGHRLTIIACLGMLVSLMSTVYITVAPESRWPAYVVIAIGASTPAAVFLMLGKEAIFVPI
ncbi:hypothetical protein ACP4OV_026654 [Aristida adscensionis]